jgi:hypothetical protein
LDLTTLPSVMRTNRPELIVSLYETGVPVAEIAARADVCVKTVRNVARRAGLPPRNAPMPERNSEVVHRYAQGDRVLAIASAHGISTGAVRRIAARAGLPPRKDWRRRYPLDEGAFDRPTSTGWWLIGLLAADGSIFAAENRVSLCQATKNIDVLHAFYAYVWMPRPSSDDVEAFRGSCCTPAAARAGRRGSDPLRSNRACTRAARRCVSKDSLDDTQRRSERQGGDLAGRPRRRWFCWHLPGGPRAASSVLRHESPHVPV